MLDFTFVFCWQTSVTTSVRGMLFWKLVNFRRSYKDHTVHHTPEEKNFPLVICIQFVYGRGIY